MLKYILVLQSKEKRHYAVDELYGSDIGDMVKCEGHAGLYRVVDRFVDIDDDLEKVLAYSHNIWKVSESYQKRPKLEVNHA